MAGWCRIDREACLGGISQGCDINLSRKEAENRYCGERSGTVCYYSTLDGEVGCLNEITFYLYTISYSLTRTSANRFKCNTAY